jgi:phage terminase large subunit-like protein
MHKKKEQESLAIKKKRHCRLTAPPITTYIDEVRADPENNCKKIKQLVELIDKLLWDSEITFDADAVDNIFNIIGAFRTYQDDATSKAGETIKLLSWERFFIGCLYGLRKCDLGSITPSILITNAYLQMAKKNGKTTFITSLALANLILIPGAEVVIVNSTYKLTAKTFDTIRAFIQQDENLSAELACGNIEIKDYAHTILYYPMASKIVAFTDGVKSDTQGLNPSFIIFDEAALYSSGEIISKLETGRNREGAYSIIITTADTNTSNPAYHEYERSTKILSGDHKFVDYLPMVYEIDKEDYDDWQNDKYWKKANPSLGIVRSIKAFRTELRKAIENPDPLGVARFKAYYLNIWSMQTAQGISDVDWQIIADNANEYTKYITPNKLKTYPVAGGLDLSLIDDFTVFTLYFYIAEIDRYYAKHRFYIPQGQIGKKMKTDTEKIISWVSKGIVTATAGKTINYQEVAEDILADFETYPNLKVIGADPAYLKHLQPHLPEDVFEDSILKFDQEWKRMGYATSDWYKGVLEGRFIDASPVMKWMVGNAEYTLDRNKNMHFEKTDYAQSSKRIDGIITSIMAHIILKENQGAQKAYDREDLLAFYSLSI